MKREEKNALSRKRIIDAAMQEFAGKGYGNASLNTVCAEHGISKGIIYHYFKDKDELYLLCVGECFNALTVYLKDAVRDFNGTPRQKLEKYFDLRLRFFAENPLLLGIFGDAALNPPPSLADRIADCRKDFDELNISILTDYLSKRTVREGLSVPAIVEDFRLYMDFFNMRFKQSLCGEASVETVLHKHEERCRQQLDILLHGLLGEQDEE